MARSKTLKKLSLLFTVLSLLLWTIKLYIHQEEDIECNFVTVQRTQNGVDHDQATDTGKNPSKWFHSKIKSLSPTHSAIQSSCPSLNHSSSLLSVEQGFTQEHLGAISAIGELHFHLSGKENKLVGEREVSLWLQNVSRLVKDTDSVLTSFSTFIRKSESENAHQVLTGLEVLGTPVVASVANTVFHQQTAAEDESSIATVRALERAGIEWVGANAKKHHIIVIRKERIGLLAYCGIRRECSEGSSTNLPFSPVKYGPRVVKSAIKELKEHGVTLIVVIMYWGLETSYFPDESSLTIARHLAALGVGVVLGYHPNLIQDHAYFGNTLVIFSLGKILSSDQTSNYCWSKIAGEWKYSSSKICAMVHPKSRESLLQKEQKTRIYRIHLTKTRPVVADYVTIRLDSDSVNGYSVRRPGPPLEGNYKWTSVCSNSDNHCLACHQF